MKKEDQIVFAEFSIVEETEIAISNIKETQDLLAVITPEMLTSMYLQAFAVSAKNKNPSGMINAVNGLAKLLEGKALDDKSDNNVMISYKVISPDDVQ